MRNETNEIVLSRENNLVVAVDVLTGVAVIAFIVGSLIKAQ